MTNEVAAEHHTHEFARITPALRSTEDDVTRDLIGIADESLGKFPTLNIIKFEIQILDSA